MTATVISQPVKFYDTIITVYDSNGNEVYNHDIDSNATVKVKLVSRYDGSAVTGESVTVTCTGGNFTKYNGGAITSAKSYTGTTDSNGEFTLTYNCSEWGLHTFSTNNINIQVQVKGWKLVQSVTNAKVYFNGEFYALFISGSVNVNAWTTIATINSNYAPKNGLSVNYSYASNTTNWIRIKTDGTITTTNALNGVIECTVFYSKY